MKRERISQNLQFQSEKSPRDYPKSPMSNLRPRNASKSPLRSETTFDQQHNIKNSRYVTPSPNSRTSNHQNIPKHSSATKVDGTRPAYVRTSYKAQHAKKLANEHEESLQLSSSTIEDHPNAKQSFIYGYSASLLNPKYFKSAEKLKEKEEFYCNFDEDAKTKSPPKESSPIRYVGKNNKSTIDEIIFRKLNSINNGHLHLNKEFDKILQRQRNHLKSLETQKIVSSQTSPTKTPQSKYANQYSRGTSPTKYSDDEGYLKQRYSHKTGSSPKRKASKKPRKEKTLPPTRDEEEKQKHLEEMKTQRLKVEQLVLQLEEENRRARNELNRVNGEDAKEEVGEESGSVNIQLKKLHFQYSQELIQQSQEIQHLKQLLEAKAKKQTQDDLKIWQTTETLVQEYTNYKQTMQTQMREHIDKYSQLIDEFGHYKAKVEYEVKQEILKLQSENSPSSKIFHLENQTEDVVEKPKKAHLPPQSQSQEDTIESLKEQLNDKERLFFVMKKDFESELNKANEKINSLLQQQSSGELEQIKAKYEEELSQQKQLYANLNQNYEALQTIAKLSTHAINQEKEKDNEKVINDLKLELEETKNQLTVVAGNNMIQKLQDEIAQLNQSLTSQKIETDGLIQEELQKNKQLTESINKILEENANLKSTLDNLLSEKQSDSHDQLKELLDQLDQAKNENTKLTEQIKTQEQEIIKEMQHSEGQLLDLKNQLSQKELHIQDIRTQQEAIIKIKEDENKTLAGLLKVKEEEVRALFLNQQKVHDSLSQDASENTKKLQDQVNEKERLLQAKDEEISSLSQEKSGLETALLEREEKTVGLLAENNKTIRQLESELKSKENECNTLTQELQRKRQMLQENQSEQEKFNLILKEVELKDEESKQLSLLLNEKQHEIQRLIQDKQTLETEHKQQLKDKTHEFQEVLEKQQSEFKSQFQDSEAKVQNLNNQIAEMKTLEEQKINETGKKLQNKQNELDQLTEVMKTNELQYTQLLENQEKIITDLNQQISALKKDNDENVKLVEQLKEVNQLLGSQEKVIADLTQQISALKKDSNNLNVELEKEKEDLRNENSKLTQENAKVIEKLTEVNQVLESQEKIITDLNQQISALKKDSNNLNVELEKEKEDLRDENAKLTQENSQLIEQLTEATKTNQLLDSQEKVITDLNQQILALKKDSNNLNIELEKEKEDLRAENTKLIEQLTEATKTNQLLESQEKVIADLNQQISTLKQNSNNLNAEIEKEKEELRAENTKLIEQLTEATKTGQLLESQEKVIADLNQQILTLKKDSNNLNIELEKEKEDLRAENTKLIEQLTEATKTGQLLESQEKVIDHLNQQISTLKQNSNTLSSDLEKEKDILRAENIKLIEQNTEALNKKNEELQHLQDKILQVTEEKDSHSLLLQTKVKELESELEAKTNALEKSQIENQSKIQSYEKELEQSNLLVSELQEKILTISQAQNNESKSQDVSELLQQKINELLHQQEIMNEESKKKDAKLKKLEEFELLKLTLEEQNNQLKFVIDEQDSQTKKLEEKNSELTKQLATLQDKENQINALQEDLLTLSNENLTWKESAAEAQKVSKQLHEKEEQLSQLKLYQENLAKELENSRKNENDFQEELLNAKLELANLKSNPAPANSPAMDQLKKENEKLAKDLKEQDEIVNYYKNEFEKMVEQVSNYSSKEMKYLQQIRELKNGKK